jgi:hypothetical protein
LAGNPFGALFLWEFSTLSRSAAATASAEPVHGDEDTGQDNPEPVVLQEFDHRHSPHPENVPHFNDPGPFALLLRVRGPDDIWDGQATCQ